MIFSQYASWIYTVLIILYAVTILSCIVVVMSERRNPIKSLAWVMALIFLPVLGLIIYLFFGRSLKNVHMISRHSRKRLLGKEGRRIGLVDPYCLIPDNRNMALLAESVSGFQLRYATNIEIFSYGSDKFSQLKEDLRAARHSINLQYYIFADDELGNEIADILREKARAGLTVRVLYDHVGSFSTRKRFFESMREAGVHAHPFFRVSFPQFANRVNWRNHRKIVVIDNTVGYIGGMNIADRYITGLSKGGKEVWRDTHVRVEGPVVLDMLYQFSIDWNFLKAKKDVAPITIPETDLQLIPFRIPAQLISSGPTDRWENIALLFMRAILSAKKSIYLQTPYFLPTDFLLKALQNAALAGVDVRIIIPRKGDSRLLSFASFSYISQCLVAGIKIYLYKPGMLHAKNLMVDDDFCTTGSANFDFRSFEHNFECNLLLYDSEVTSRMKRQFLLDAEQSELLTLSKWSGRPRLLRAAESVVRLLAPIL